MNYSIPPQDMQEREFDKTCPLRDYTTSGQARPWRDKKMRNELLSAAYFSVDQRKAERLQECGELLRFKKGENGLKTLDFMTSCRVRLCPMCSWRRSLKTFFNTDAIIRYVSEKKRYRFLLLTLTVRNCNGDKLSGEIDNIFAGFNRLLQLAAVKRAVKGGMRTLEVTHNTEYGNVSYDTYHPHLHVLLAVNPSYFTSAAYISHEKWRDMWQKSCRLDYLPEVSIKAVKPKKNCALVERAADSEAETREAVAEVSKYAVKDADYIVPDDWDLSVDAVRTLDGALNNRRLISYFGIFKTAKAELLLEDEESGDLIHVGDEVQNADEVYTMVEYGWFSGAREYYRMRQYQR